MNISPACSRAPELSRTQALSRTQVPAKEAASFAFFAALVVLTFLV